MLKPFVPQLQTTFIKALSDSNRIVRVHSANALGSLMTISPKVDPLINELLNGVSHSDGAVQEAMLTALQQVLLKAGKSVTPETTAKIGKRLTSVLESEDENIRLFAARSLGAYSKHLPEDALGTLMTDILASTTSWQMKQGRCMALKSILYHSPQLFSKYSLEIRQFLQDGLKDERVAVRQSACDATSRLLLLPQFAASSDLPTFLKILANLISDNSNDVKLAAVRAIKKFAKAFPEVGLAATLLTTPGNSCALGHHCTSNHGPVERPNQFAGQACLRTSADACAANPQRCQCCEGILQQVGT